MRLNQKLRRSWLAGEKSCRLLVTGWLSLLVTGLFMIGHFTPAAAYVGPGAGITAIGALWAVILAILFAVGGLLLWPVRAMWLRMRRNRSRKSISGEGPMIDDE